MSEKNFHNVSLSRIQEAVRAYGMQKRLAADLMMSDTELSRLVHEQAPKLTALLALLNLEVVEAGHVAALKAVLKEVL